MSPQKMVMNKKIIFHFLSTPKVVKKSSLFSLPKQVVKIFIFKIFPPLETVVKIEVFFNFSPPPPQKKTKTVVKINALSHLVHRRQAKKHYLTREFFANTGPMCAFIYFT